jgi:hypothetical protein
LVNIQAHESVYVTFQTAEGSQIRPELFPVNGYGYVAENGQYVSGFICIFRGVAMTDGEFIFDYRREGSSGNQTLRILNVDGCITEQQFDAAPILSTNTVAYVDGQWGSSAVLPVDFTVHDIAFVYVGATTQAHEARLSISNADTTSQWVHDDYSLWELVGSVEGSDTIEKQYNGAQRYAITGLSALLSNTSAGAYKSGSLVAAQLPGGSEYLVPTTGEEMYRFIASYNDPKTFQGQLNKGVHWFFSPEKIQDWFYTSTREDIPNVKPYLAIAWSGVAVNDLANMLGLTLNVRVNIELLTTDVSVIKFSPSADLSRLMDLYLTLVSAHNPIGENPNHKDKIKKIVSKILSDPATKRLINEMKSAGRTLIPLALSTGLALL